MASSSVLCTPELLSKILEYTHPSGQVSAAITCRMWSGFAFYWIWRDMASILPVIQILAPLKVMAIQRENYQTLPNTIPSDRWERLRFYGKYIRSITHIDDSPLNGLPIHSSTYSSMMSVTMHRRPFFPNLRSLTWSIAYSSSLIAISLLASPDLSDVAFWVNDDMNDHALVASLLDVLQGRVENLKSFAIWDGTPIEFIDGKLSSVLGEMAKLQMLCIPQFYLSPLIVETVGSLSCLKTLRFSFGKSSKPEYNEEGCQFRFGSNLFPVLERLQCNMELRRAVELLHSTHAPAFLKELCLVSPNQASLQDFLLALVGSQPRLQDLSLILYAEKTSVMESLHFKDLSPLLALPLVHLSIYHNHPLAYSPQDVATMGSSWPQIEELYLSNEPVIGTGGLPPKGQPLDILIHFAAQLRLLKSLGVYFEIEDNFHLHSFERQYVRFYQLEALDIGTSLLSRSVNRTDIAIFLASLLPTAECTLDFDSVVWISRFSLNIDTTLWEDVAEEVKKFFKAQNFVRSLGQ